MADKLLAVEPVVIVFEQIIGYEQIISVVNLGLLVFLIEKRPLAKCVAISFGISLPDRGNIAHPNVTLMVLSLA